MTIDEPAVSPIGQPLRDAKQALRASAVAARDALSAEYRAGASARIASQLATLATFRRAAVVLVNLPFRSEWDTGLLAHEALLQGKILAVPRVDPTARMLALHRVTDIATQATPGYRSIPEPDASLPLVDPGTIDWVLVPGVAFDFTGRRLGYGGGYYDRLLPTLKPGVPRVAGAFEVQLVARVPAAPHDVAVDCVVTERRIVEIAS